MPLELAKQLIACPSVTPNDAGCQDIIAELLTRAGFSVEHHPFGEVSNLYAFHGTQKPLLLLLGHTDVVPVGNLQAWQTDPFTATEKDGNLYGRGACDMKISLAAMVVAAIEFVKQYPTHKGSIGFLITSDEEGDAQDGTQKVLSKLFGSNNPIDYCLIGEPTSSKKLADTIKNGRRGSLSAQLTIHGKQGHIAYPHLADNPIHKALAALDELVNIQWDSGYKNFPATSLQISNINAGTGVSNVIPADLIVSFNLRFSPALTPEKIKAQIIQLLDRYKFNYTINWNLSAKPFASKQGALTTASIAAIEEVVGYTPELSTSGGTSDGRFVAPYEAEIIELGLLNATAHQVNEHVAIADIEQLTNIYTSILHKLLS
jgi:succinyl-diaminopimelate desuccinylase